MEHYSVINDFENYINENIKLIHFLESNDSLLSDYVSPVIKTLVYLVESAKKNEKELNQEEQNIFEHGFEYLFENLEQIKLYLRQFKSNYQELENRSFVIKQIFNYEEFKNELYKIYDMNPNDEIRHDLNKIDDALNFLEESLINYKHMNELDLDKYIELFFELSNKYDSIILLNEAFSQYCNTYGI